MEHINHIDFVKSNNPYLAFIFMICMLIFSLVIGLVDLMNTIKGWEIPPILIQTVQLIALIVTIVTGISTLKKNRKK